ncbi:MAG: hypothetical protein ACYS9X_24355 [Planctomycetota bacterium]|jgi:hypothetical protein
MYVRRTAGVGDGDSYSVKRGGGCLMLFGLPFFAAGVGIIVAALAGVMESDSGDPPPLFVIIPFGLIFASIGAAFMFGRAGVLLDSRSRTITEWWGLLVPFKSEVTSFDEVNTVTISRETRSSKNSTYTVYPVRIEGEEGVIDIEEPREYAKARRRAEEIAKFLGFGVADSSSGTKVVREAGTLDMSLRDLVRASGERPERPERPGEQPAGGRVNMTSAGSQATFDLPPPGLGTVGAVAVVIGLVFACVPFVFFGGAFFATDLLEDIGNAWPFFIFAGIFALVWLGGTLGFVVKTVKKATARGRLVVDPRGLTFETRSFLGTKTVTISADELEELELVGADDPRVPAAVPAFMGSDEHVVARSDRAEVEFGRGLSRGELEWLRDTVRFIVTS